MKIDSNRLKHLRTKKNWSQEQLSEACGLSLRTIQRLENGGNASIESVRALADVYDIEPTDLIINDETHIMIMRPIDAIKQCLLNFNDFSGIISRYEYGWFFLFVLFALAISTLIDPQAYQLVAVILLIPFLSATTRRLRDVNVSIWWQLMWIVPFGQVVVLYLLAQPASKFADTKIASVT